MVSISTPVEALLGSDAVAHVWTNNPDGSPQVSVVWVIAHGDEILFGTDGASRKARNLAHDPRIILSIEDTERNERGFQRHLVIRGRATIEPGPNPEVMDRLAAAYGLGHHPLALRDSPTAVLVRVTVDRVSGVGPWVDLTMGFYKVAKYYYGPGFHEGSTANELLINESEWQSLPKDLQAIVRAACHELNMTVPAEYFARSTDALATLVNEHGVTIKTFPDEVYAEAYRISEEVNAETANEGDLNRRIYESWSAFRKNAMDYQPLSDFGFIRNRRRAIQS